MANKMGPYLRIPFKQLINQTKNLSDAREGLLKILYNDPINWELGEVEQIEKLVELITTKLVSIR